MIGGGGSSYNDGWIRKKLNTIDDDLDKLRKLKRIDSYMSKQKESGWSYDPQLPFHLHRKNERFDYTFFGMIVTDKGTEKILNEMGNAGWMIESMGIVDEDSGSAPFMFKLNLQGQWGVNPTKFNYKCFSYELASSYLLEGKVKAFNKQGYDYTTGAAWNKTHSFVLMTKVIY